MTGDLSYQQAVSAWAAHLRAGGTTPWRDWHPDDARDVPVMRPLPDALHLELVRRVNQAAVTQPSRGAGDLTGLADRVLTTAAPGRGLLDVPLPWPAAVSRFGSPAIDPDRLPREELVRVAVGVLAHLLPDVPPPQPQPQPPRFPTPWRRRFRLHGAPCTVAAVRRSLLAQGHVETDWRPTHVVVARPVDVMMAEHWSAAVRNGGILKWTTTWRRAQAAGRLPGDIDVAAIARRLEDRRREPVHVVVARDVEHAAALTAGVLRARPAGIRSSGDAAVSDLLRRLNRLTALTHSPGRVRELARTLATLLDEGSAPPYPTATPVTPPASLPWALEVAATSAEELRRAGYAVHGDPDELSPTEHELPGTVDREHTLELAVTACLRTWQLGGNP